jgi:hypothetical protein
VKKIFYVALLWIIAATANAQSDAILKKDGETISCKIINIEPDFIYFVIPPDTITQKISSELTQKVLLESTSKRLKQEEQILIDKELRANNKFIVLGINSGIRHIGGIIGTHVEIRVYKGLAFNGSVGIGGWGIKKTLGIRLFTNYPFGLNYFISRTSASGAKGIPMNDGTNQLVNLNPQILGNIGFGYNWKIGNTFRLGLDVGYSVSFTNGETHELVDAEGKSTSNIPIKAPPEGFLIGILFGVLL